MEGQGDDEEFNNPVDLMFDAQDNIVKVTDALKHVTRYTYDQNGNLLTETDALGNRVTYAYTPEGWLESVTKADGTVLAFAYDGPAACSSRTWATGRRWKAAITTSAWSRRSPGPREG